MNQAKGLGRFDATQNIYMFVFKGTVYLCFIIESYNCVIEVSSFCIIKKNDFILKIEVEN